PLIFLFNSVGVNVTIIATALSLLYPLGDCLPPSRISGRVAVDVSGYKGSYMSFLGAILVPCVFMAVVAVLMLIYANKLSWLIVY
ncbi:MAG: citrate transporter, partial [Pyramidobacter porci]|nr:citrate transporter [Pyramidobacter porci]